MGFFVILQQMGMICILVAIGIGLQKKGVVDSLTSRKISAIVVDVCNPALIMSSILSGDITAGHRDLIMAVILGAVFYFVMILLAFIMPRILRSDPGKRRFYHLMTVYTNIGFLGIPVAKAALPPNALIYIIVVNVFYSLLFYTHGLAVLRHVKKGDPDAGRVADQGETENGKESTAASIRNVLNPGTIMAVLSLVVFWYNLELPPIIANTVSYVGNATVFLSMVLLGVSIARSDLGKCMRDLRIWIFILLRMIMLPVAAVILMKYLKFDSTAILAMCLLSAMPVGNLPLIQAEKMGEDTTTLSSAIVVTTAVSMVTVTFLLVFTYNILS